MTERDEAEILAQNIRGVRERISRAASRRDRDPAEIDLVAVSKTVPAERVALAFRLGLTEFGENRVQEAAGKVPQVTSLISSDVSPDWHLVGHLQTNKAREAVKLFDMIQSVDSANLAGHISREAGRLARTVRLLLEVNVGREPQKHGFTPENVAQAATEIVRLPHIEIVGLMTVAPLVSDPEAVRPVFRSLRELRDQLRDEVPAIEWRHLSMGMTDDFEVAIEEGATVVRLGRAIFGARG